LLVHAWRRLLDASGFVAGTLVALIALGVCADVALRSIGAGGIGWMLEAIEYLQYAMVLIGAAWVLARGAHVAIDAVLLALSPERRARMERVASGFGALASGIFAAVCLTATIDLYKTGAVLHKSFTLPEWLPIAGLALAFLMLAIEFGLQASGRGEIREQLDL